MKKANFIKTILFAATLVLQLSTLSFHSHGAAGDVDLSFDAGFFPGVSVAHVRAVVVQPDGKVIIAGTGIARVNADGSKDSSFARPIDPNVPVGIIFALALQSDGKVLLAHEYGVSRLNSDGSWDTNFTAPTTLDENLFTEGARAVVVQPDGKILIGGAFRVVNGTIRNSIARLNANGSLDSSFIAETIDNSFSVALCIAVQSDGNVLIGGHALTWRNDSVARLNTNGSLDSNFFSARPDDQISSLAVQLDGKVLIGGTLTSDTGSYFGVARVNANGSPDSSFNPGLGVKAFALQGDGKVLVGGDLLNIGGSNVRGIARLHSGGSLDNTFSPELSPQASISTVTLQSDGKVLISGPDVTGNVAPDYNLLTRLGADGNRDDTFIAGEFRGGFANWMMPQADGRVLIGGGFPFIDGTNDAVVARLNANGSLDRILSTNAALVRASLQPDGKWLAGDASTRFHADWSVDNGFQAPVVDYAIHVAVAQLDGRVLIGGGFETVNGTNRNGIARLHVDGTLDSTFNPEIASAGTIRSILVQPDGKLLVGGEFLSANLAYYHGLVRLNADGSLDSSFNHVAATNGFVVNVVNILLQPDDKVLISGWFSYVHGARRDYIARLNANGSLDSTFDAGSFNLEDLPHVRGAGAMTLQPDGKLLVLGDYYLGDNKYIGGIFRLNTNGTVDASLNRGIFDVRSAAVQPDGKILISGGFLAVNGVARPYMARLLGDSLPPLSIARSNAFFMVSWLVSGVNLRLEESTDLALPNSWSAVAQSAVTNSGQIAVTVPASKGSKFFRLTSQ